MSEDEIRYDEDMTPEEREAVTREGRWLKVTYGPDLRVSQADALAASAPLGAMAVKRWEKQKREIAAALHVDNAGIHERKKP